jgi:hypothetical protein
MGAEITLDELEAFARLLLEHVSKMREGSA